MSKILLGGFVSLVVLAPHTALAVCETPTTAEELSRAWGQAQSAFANIDEGALLTQSTLVRTQILPCLGEPLVARETAAFHRIMAFEAFINGDDARTVAELHAALKLDPGFTFPTSVVGPEHPLLSLNEAAAMAPDGEPELVYPPKDGYILVAGVRNAARYRGTPVVIQVFGPSGALVETRYVQPGESLPKWSDNPLGLTVADLGSKRSWLKDPRPWYIAAGVSALAGGVLYAAAVNERSLFQDPGTSDEDLPLHEQSANTLGTASVIAAGTTLVFAGVGLGFQMTFGAHKPTTLSTEAAIHAP